MRLVRLATPISMLCLALAGCGGGSKVVVQEVPNGSSVAITVPGGEALAPKATATATAQASVTPTPTAASGTTAPAQSQTTPQTQSQTQTTPQQTTPQSTAGGGAAAPDANPTPPPGADAQKFEAFCQQNPGAC